MTAFHALIVQNPGPLSSVTSLYKNVHRPVVRRCGPARCGYVEAISMQALQEIRMKTQLLFTILALAAVTVQAQTATPKVDQRQDHQEKRIEQGAASGQLTPREANRLEKKQERVERVEERAKADGKVTAKERAHMDNVQDRTSRDIRREKHDRQRDMNHDGRKDRPKAAKS
jgi:hypothetical protein